MTHTVDARIRFFSKKMPFKAGHGCGRLRCFLLLSTREKTPQIVIGLSGWTTAAAPLCPALSADDSRQYYFQSRDRHRHCPHNLNTYSINDKGGLGLY